MQWPTKQLTKTHGCSISANPIEDTWQFPGEMPTAAGLLFNAFFSSGFRRLSGYLHPQIPRLAVLFGHRQGTSKGMGEDGISLSGANRRADSLGTNLALTDKLELGLLCWLIFPNDDPPDVDDIWHRDVIRMNLQTLDRLALAGSEHKQIFRRLLGTAATASLPNLREHVLLQTA